jgi:hypothetical protein
MDEEPLQPYTIDWELDEEGDRLLNGNEVTAGAAGRGPEKW